MNEPMAVTADEATLREQASNEAHVRTALQAARLPLAIQRAREKASNLKPDSAADLLVRASQRAPTVVQRVLWLHKAAIAWSKPIAAVAACRKGCAHCCHIPVTISSREAKLISAATHRKLQEPARSVRLRDFEEADSTAAASTTLQHWGTSTACPFLVDDACGIYASRPLSCRVLFNLDDDDLLCQHGAHEPAVVPYADSRMIRALALAAQPSEQFADIRDFFPPAS